MKTKRITNKQPTHNTHSKYRQTQKQTKTHKHKQIIQRQLVNNSQPTINQIQQAIQQQHKAATNKSEQPPSKSKQQLTKYNNSKPLT